jgi:hypothetical protein
LIRLRRMDQQVGRLVQNDDVLVLVNDVERDLRRFDAAMFRFHLASGAGAPDRALGVRLSSQCPYASQNANPMINVRPSTAMPRPVKAIRRISLAFSNSF